MRNRGENAMSSNLPERWVNSVAGKISYTGPKWREASVEQKRRALKELVERGITTNSALARYVDARNAGGEISRHAVGTFLDRNKDIIPSGRKTTGRVMGHKVRKSKPVTVRGARKKQTETEQINSATPIPDQSLTENGEVLVPIGYCTKLIDKAQTICCGESTGDKKKKRCPHHEEKMAE
ncbi:MAG: hypothetical protein WA021_05715 [Minisyncoccia bacterium]